MAASMIAAGLRSRLPEGSGGMSVKSDKDGDAAMSESADVDGGGGSHVPGGAPYFQLPVPGSACASAPHTLLPLFSPLFCSRDFCWSLSPLCQAT